MDRFIHSRQGFTLIELLVVIAIIGLLASMLLPAVMKGRITAEMTADGNNMKEVIKMFIVDRTDTRQTWSFPRGNSNFHPGSAAQPNVGGSPSNANGIDVTNVCMFTLAARHEINADLFSTQANGKFIEGLADAQKAGEKNWTVDQIAAWTSPSTNSITETDLPYAFDWSAPKTSGTARITLALRDKMAYKQVPAIYADTHIGFLDYDENTGAVINTAATPVDENGVGKNGLLADDIFTSNGDITPVGSSPVLPRHIWLARGDTVRTHVK